ncbi:TPA: hypothetical protein ACTAOB_002249 [Salmonella enterica subsp. enterica serovar Oranienburg]|uniref:Uncharacterized protein n=1 Tax=Salmonella enterica subsp. enterica serovar Give var. 15 str. CFSAN004343 TaxID=1410932 RepID=A0AAU7EQ63_SALET|nr:hypothetical protein [Salmonella enterica]ESH04411.1 hypothetical protein SEEG0564_21063 [Salmonella enterica subsp. enterica serovar Give str. 564]ETC67863.1 hypothetical protein SEEE3402_17105 [Salmonella enterica subsp. enterica serovar Enteritidis str. 3402]KHP24414.1 hypothetical protein QS22_16985 [Salmonella enterica subsp. enterica serovar Brandenburg]KNN29703.1 hypothetical protein AEV14_17665 [Salmonella enterica subsp. enterica serovar Brandenburg]KNP76386.1 hypothetical protein 
MGLVTLFSSHDGYLPDFALALADRAEPQVTFEYTFTVKHCIDTIAGFLKRVEVEPHPAIVEILTQFESTVRQCPLGCQICPELVPATGSLTTLKAIGFCIRSRES